MISDLKLGLKMIKYGLNLKTSLISGLIFFVLGLLLTIFDPMANYSAGITSLGSFYLIMSGIFITQQMVLTTISKFVQASAYKKTLQTTAPCLTSFLTMLIGYTIMVIIRLVQKGIFFTGEVDEAVAAGIYCKIVVAGLLVFLFELYMVVAYKAYIVGMVVMIAVMIPLLILPMGVREELVIKLFSGFGYFKAIIVGYVEILAGLIAALPISKALYKFDLSELSYRAALKKNT